jgi:hypothetical protein
MDEALPADTCLEYGDECSGAVTYQLPMSGTGVSYPRCEHHADQRLALQERLNRDYPDSPNPPAWFDPTYAGEHWDEDY